MEIMHSLRQWDGISMVVAGIGFVILAMSIVFSWDRVHPTLNWTAAVIACTGSIAGVILRQIINDMICRGY